MFCVKCPSSLEVERSRWGRRHGIIFREGGIRENIAKTATLLAELLDMKAVAFISVMFSFTCFVGNVLRFCRIFFLTNDGRRRLVKEF